MNSEELLFLANLVSHLSPAPARDPYQYLYLCRQLGDCTCVCTGSWQIWYLYLYRQLADLYLHLYRQPVDFSLGSGPSIPTSPALSLRTLGPGGPCFAQGKKLLCASKKLDLFFEEEAAAGTIAVL